MRGLTVDVREGNCCADTGPQEARNAGCHWVMLPDRRWVSLRWACRRFIGRASSGIPSCSESSSGASASSGSRSETPPTARATRFAVIRGSVTKPRAGRQTGIQHPGSKRIPRITLLLARKRSVWPRLRDNSYFQGMVNLQVNSLFNDDLRPESREQSREITVSRGH